MRQIVLDTETTGLEPAQGHRIIEIGAVELVDRRLSGRHFHKYVNPERDIDDGAFEVHGLSREFLADKPVFAAVAEEFLDFIKGAEVIIHNAGFDVAFLDHELVEYVQSIPASHKVNGKMKKRILQDAFREILPRELYNRPKQGFEVPLLNWFRTELKSLILDDLLELNFIRDQGIFNVNEIRRYRKKLFSLNPGDIHAHVWALIIFQSWWKKYFS